MKATDPVDPNEIYNPMLRPHYTLTKESYKSLEEKQQYWNANAVNPHLHYDGHIDTIEQFEGFIATMNGQTNCIFRGLNEAKYKLFTSLQVHYLKNAFPFNAREFVAREISELKGAHGQLFPRYFRAMDIAETDFLYLSLMQHYSAKTPFLDFSYSLNKALFFAQDGYQDNLSSNDIDNYVSLYWIDVNETKGFELIDIIQWYPQQLERALDMLKNLIESHPNINVDFSILNWDKFLSWMEPQNHGEGFNQIELGYITDRRAPIVHKTTKSEYDTWLVQFVKDVKSGSFNGNPNLMSDYYTRFYNAIIQNVKLTNLNITAQEGCFILYNPYEGLVPFEDFWSHNITYQHLPTLHCVDISKRLITSLILPLLKQNGITHDTMYPLEKDVVSSIVDMAK